MHDNRQPPAPERRGLHLGAGAGRVLLRLLRLIVHLLVGLALAMALRHARRWLRPEAVARWWSGRLLAILGIRSRALGEPDPQARFLVANHVSWLDVPVLAARHRLRFVAKAEVRHWPLAGPMTAAVGTFFIRRGSGDSHQVAEALAAYLRQGGAVAVFPEGTTTAGRSVQRFHSRLFHAAVAAEVKIQPLAICYGRAEDGSDIAPFIGDAGLLNHLWRLLREPGLEVQLQYCPTQAADGRSASELAPLVHEAVAVHLASLADRMGAPVRSTGEPIIEDQPLPLAPG